MRFSAKNENQMSGRSVSAPFGVGGFTFTPLKPKPLKLKREAQATELDPRGRGRGEPMGQKLG